MKRRRLLVLLGAAAAGAAAVLRQRSTRTVRVDLYLEDGSLVTLEPGSPQAERMLAIARDALRAARLAA